MPTKLGPVQATEGMKRDFGMVSNAILCEKDAA